MKLPENFGQCFDATGLAFVNFPRGAVLCHGIGVANLPEQRGKPIMHAWIEYDGMAYDAVWLVKQPIMEYRCNLRVSYLVRYTFEEAWANWLRIDYPGPWNEKILAVKGDNT